MAIYNAGNAYLQILPSFRGIERLMQRETAKLAKSIDKSMATAAGQGLVDAFKDIDTDRLAKGARETGDKWANAFERQISSHLKDMSDNLPTFAPKADLDQFDEALKNTRKEIAELSKTKLSPGDGGGGLDQLGRKLDDITARMTKLSDQADDAGRKVQLRDVARQAQAIRDLVADAEQQGQSDGRKYGGAFSQEAKRAVAAALKDIPEIQVGADTGTAERKVAELREKLVKLGDKHIGVDIDEHEFTRQLAQITARLESLKRNPANVGIKFDLDAAYAQLRTFQEKTGQLLAQQQEQNGRRAGGVWAGAYASEVDARLRRAAEALPVVPVKLNDSDAQTKMRAIRAAILSLADKTVGVDIDAGEATAKIAVLKAALEELDGDDVEIDIKTNAARAAAELALISAEAKESSMSFSELSQNAGITMSRLGYMIAIGASLGSLIAPAAATAAIAIAGIGTAALSAVAGFGVLALGLYGVADAVKKIDAYQQDANKSAHSFSQAQNRIVTATQQVGDAERNLANTRQDAADAAVQAQERIADAQRNVAKIQRDTAEAVQRAREQEKETVKDLGRARADAADQIYRAIESESDAERSATRAVIDQKKARDALSDAIKQATQDLRELQTEVKRNQLDIDEATTAAMKAKQELDKIMTNPRATEVERRQALEAYQDKVIQIEELKNKQQELADQQKEADKSGVEGTKKVKDARQAVADADERAADAARRLEDARKAVDKARVDASEKIADAQKRVADATTAVQKAQRDGAERVADAQRAVTDAQRAAAKQQRDAQRQILAGTEAVANAQRSLAQASEAAGVAGGDAFDTMNDALNKLSPAGQAFARWLYSLKPALDRLRQSAQEGLLPGLQNGIQTLVANYLPAFDRFVSKIATGLGNMFRATGQVLLTPSWREFFGFINDEALPSLQSMWVMSVNLATGIINVVRALSPLSKPLGAGLVDLTEKFARWSETLQANSGFKDFTEYAERVGPKVAYLIEQMATFVGRLVVAAAPMGEVVLDAVTAVFQFINSWDLDTLSSVVEVVTILGIAVWTLTGFVRTVKFVTEAWNAITLVAAKAQTVLSAAVVRYNAATVGATTTTGLLNGRLFATQAAGTAGAAGMSAMTAAAGPLGIALAGIAAVWYIQTRNERAAKAATDQLGPSLEQLGDAYRKAANQAALGSDAVTESFKNIVSSNSQMQQAVVTLTSLGASLDDVAAAAGGSEQALDKVVQLIETRIAALKQEEKDHFFSIFDNEDRDKEMERLWALEDQFKSNAEAAHLTNQAMTLLNQSTRDANDASGLLSTSERALADAQDVLADSSSTAQQKMDALTKAQDTMRQSTIDAIEADESFNSGLISLKESVKSAKDAHDKNATSLALNTTQGLRNRDAIEALVQSADRMYDADVSLNGVTAAAVKKGQDHYKQIIAVAGALGISTDQAKALIGQYGKIPKNVETAIGFKQGQFDKMFQQLEMTAFIQKGLKEGKDIDTVRQDYKNLISDRNRAKNHGWATGGPIAGAGIVGGPTEDANLIWASKGEYMQQAAAVDYYGTGLMDALNRRAIPREAFPGFASGGSVGGSQKWPFTVDLSNVWTPSTDWLLANTPGIPTGDGSFSGVLSPNKTVAAMQKFALAQRGKRYLWSAVGPNRYDCSGLTGDLWAIATGHSLYHRYMSTSDMGPGRHGMVAGPGKYWTVYLGPGHTASNIAGLHAEAYGGNGVPLAIGRIGTRLSYYNQKLHLPGFAQGGMVDDSDLTSKRGRLTSFLRYGWPEPPRTARIDLNDLLKSTTGGTYDAGGMLPPGYSTVFNGTGRPEPVLTSAQWQAIDQIAAGGGGAGDTYQFEFRDTTLDPSKLRALQTQQAVKARQGRAR